MTHFAESILKYRRIAIVVIGVVFTQFLELTILAYKYDLFTGGFLQPFSYITWGERGAFLLLSIWFDLVFFLTVTGVWFLITDKLEKFGPTNYYVLTVAFLFSIGAWIALKFELLSYFNDVVNLQLLRNLGGGSIKQALLYVINEITISIALIALGILFLIYLHSFFKKNKFIALISSTKNNHVAYLELLVGVILITPFILIYVRDNDFIRYGLEKKTSYRFVSQFFDTLSDIDFDGYGSFRYPKDKEIFDASIFPGALDIPGNGIDEDGFLGDAEFPSEEVDHFSNLPHKTGKHIVLIVLESARADLLNKEIDGKPVTPEINDLAKNGKSIDYAYSHIGFTVGSLYALFNRDLIHTGRKTKLIPFLKQSGYGISVISGQDESFGNIANDTEMTSEGNYYFDAKIAINDRVFPSKDSGSLRLTEERVVKAFIERAHDINWQKPQFFYINFQAAHFPYAHPLMLKKLEQDLIPRSKIKPENKAWVEKTYWNAISSADWAVGEVVKELATKKMLENTTIVILGDHGESLFDDGFLGHGHALNDIQTKIPLIINDANVSINEPIGQMDVAELMLKSSLNIPVDWQNLDKKVFQFVGGLSHPSLIAHVEKEGIRTLFDFRSEQVFFSDLQRWKPFNDSLEDTQLKDRVVKLIKDWENLRWLESQGKLKVNTP